MGPLARADSKSPAPNNNMMLPSQQAVHHPMNRTALVLHYVPPADTGPMVARSLVLCVVSLLIAALLTICAYCIIRVHKRRRRNTSSRSKDVLHEQATIRETSAFLPVTDSAVYSNLNSSTGFVEESTGFVDVDFFSLEEQVILDVAVWKGAT